MRKVELVPKLSVGTKVLPGWGIRTVQSSVRAATQPWECVASAEGLVVEDYTIRPPLHTYASPSIWITHPQTALQHLGNTWTPSLGSLKPCTPSSALSPCSSGPPPPVSCPT